MNDIRISNKIVGVGEPVFIVAEGGVNHNGQLELAQQLIEVAAEAGADAVKFQTFDPSTLVTKSALKAKYQDAAIGQTESQYDMLERLMLKREYHPELKNYAESKGLIFLSTPFSRDDADYLIDLGVPALKVGSTDTNNLPYLSYIAQKRLPIILSTGMSSLVEVKESVDTIKAAGNEQIIVLQCTTNYPTPYSEANLKAMLTLRDELGLLTGFSDHTLGIEVAIAAAALGAAVIEKHYTLDRNLPGPDHKASLEPAELKDLIAGVRHVEQALGTGVKSPLAVELEIAKIVRKSLVAKRFIPVAKKITDEDITFKRPGTGLAPKYYSQVVGQIAKKDIAADALIQEGDY